ncbi:unnamed protein product [Kuraishia capsulata CBS 1993]|uniref:Ribosomal protein S14 n=1 Tax=Kuraishia capsulata CBS 1993 TaxID=1382522 RepID=W6MQJ1_9ASCO|nr:uncharacterized protein KUCA_T00003505001 [Kuraishia capsulata CBS 1993]CDK27527.1 unnamed protein product [Kuraishia capsulata CBS 1993]
MNKLQPTLKQLKRFPKPVALPSTYLNARVIKDHFKRQMFAENEVTTRALKFIARNTALPPRARLEAQVQLTSMPNYTRFTQVRDRCVDSGRGKGILSDFRLCRARKGLLTGVTKGQW